MSLKFVASTMHDGKPVIKINPVRVNYLISLESVYTKIHFGLDQTVRSWRTGSRGRRSKWFLTSPNGSPGFAADNSTHLGVAAPNENRT